MWTNPPNVNLLYFLPWQLLKYQCSTECVFIIFFLKCFLKKNVVLRTLGQPFHLRRETIHRSPSPFLTVMRKLVPKSEDEGPRRTSARHTRSRRTGAPCAARRTRSPHPSADRTYSAVTVLFASIVSRPRASTVVITRTGHSPQGMHAGAPARPGTPLKLVMNTRRASSSAAASRRLGERPLLMARTCRRRVVEREGGHHQRHISGGEGAVDGAPPGVRGTIRAPRPRRTGTERSRCRRRWCLDEAAAQQPGHLT